MPNNPKVHYIPANPPKREKRVGIYCRVSTNSMDQLQSLIAQVSHLTRLTATMPQWLLSDVYMDIATSKTGSSRKEFNQMLKDCKSHKLEIVITKDVSRFGRDTVEVLDAFNQLKALGVRVIFEGNSLDTANTSSNLMVAVIESIAQAENESRRSIEWILSNEKYTGNVELLKSSKSEVHYLASGSHPAIISKEVFETVQMEKGRRSNVVRDENGSKRKSKKYSSKK